MLLVILQPGQHKPVRSGQSAVGEPAKDLQNIGITGRVKTV
jgi:hypothetical protein